jgi:hypothetical protein
MATTVTKDVEASVAQVGLQFPSYAVEFPCDIFCFGAYFERIPPSFMLPKVIKIADEGADLVRLTVQGR